jgi:hypothetical protein
LHYIVKSCYKPITHVLSISSTFKPPYNFSSSNSPNAYYVPKIHKIKTDTPFDRLVNSSTLTGSLRAAWASSPYLFLKQGPQNWKKEKEKKKSDLMSIWQRKSNPLCHLISNLIHLTTLALMTHHWNMQDIFRLLYSINICFYQW